MSKNDFLHELERLLKLNNIDNKYSILRDYTSKISALSDKDDLNEKFGTPEDIVKSLVKIQSCNDDFDEKIIIDIDLKTDVSNQEEIIDFSSENTEILNENNDDLDLDNDISKSSNEQFKGSILDDMIGDKKNKNIEDEDIIDVDVNNNNEDQFKGSILDDMIGGKKSKNLDEDIIDVDVNNNNEDQFKKSIFDDMTNKKKTESTNNKDTTFSDNSRYKKSYLDDNKSVVYTVLAVFIILFIINTVLKFVSYFFRDNFYTMHGMSLFPFRIIPLLFVVIISYFVYKIIKKK